MNIKKSVGLLALTLAFGVAPAAFADHHEGKEAGKSCANCKHGDQEKCAHCGKTKAECTCKKGADSKKGADAKKAAPGAAAATGEEHHDHEAH